MGIFLVGPKQPLTRLHQSLAQILARSIIVMLRLPRPKQLYAFYNKLHTLRDVNLVLYLERPNERGSRRASNLLDEDPGIKQTLGSSFLNAMMYHISPELSRIRGVDQG